MRKEYELHMLILPLNIGTANKYGDKFNKNILIGKIVGNFLLY